VVAVPAIQVPLPCKRYPVLHERHCEVLPDGQEAQFAVALHPVLRTAWVQAPLAKVYPAIQAVQVRAVPDNVHVEQPATFPV